MGLKNKIKRKPKIKLTRKQLRKEKRKEKKVKRNEYYTKRGKNAAVTDNSASEPRTVTKPKEKLEKIKPARDANTLKRGLVGNKVLSTEEHHRKEKKEQKKIEKDMFKQRKEQLLKANMLEDKTIKKMEKQLKLHKRKTKAIPKSFAADGLDYLLEVCDTEYLKNAGSAEQDLLEANDEFEEDFALVTGQKTKSTRKKNVTVAELEREDSDDSIEELLNENNDSEDNIWDSEEGDMSNNISDGSYSENSESDLESEHETMSKKPSKLNKEEIKKRKKNVKKETDLESVNEINDSDTAPEEIPIKSVKRKSDSDKDQGKKRQKLNLDNSNVKKQTDKIETKVQLNDSADESEDNTDLSGLDQDGSDSDGLEDKQRKDEVWEDIYGRLRSKDGAVIDNSGEKYIPPAIRAKMAESGSENKKRKEKLDRLRKQLKGLLNRLAESNMHNVAGQIENLYMNNSRNDMNETLNSLINESLVSTVLTPERLLMEHVLLIAILHANVGTEVGANFLQTTIKKFDHLSKTPQNVEDKSLDNIVNILAQLYNFKVFDAKLLYEILQKLTNHFEEKNVECILHVLRSVGFGLRKDDPIALKNLILDLQKQAASASEGKVNNSRVKFLLDVLLAIKNNNVTKIPNYDTTYSEHLKKIMKGFVRKGNYVTPLNISLEDLLKADERGKWWVVGSAWTGNIEEPDKKEKSAKSDVFSQKLLDLARKQRMNTDTRRDIFCIIMSAEDYLDAFEKLLRLGLKNQQEREIIHVILHCCLQEKNYNPYYAVLAQKFCEYDRKFQMTIKYSVWDKLKTLNNHPGEQISNLAKLLTYLFIEKGLPISTLKVVEFSELDKITLRFMRQILLGILLHNDLEALQGVFVKVAQSDKLKMFRESLRLFIHHFLLRNLKTEVVPDDQKKNLQERAKLVEKVLMTKEVKFKL